MAAGPSSMTTDLELVTEHDALNPDLASPSGGVIVGETPQDILASATVIANALHDLIEKQGFSVNVGRDRKHVEVGGWQAAGAMLGAFGGQPLHAETAWSKRVPHETDIVYEAAVEIRTLAGAVVGRAEALCSSAERNWNGRDEFAVKSMAETRAESRAYRRAIGWVIGLAGYNSTPAEEIDPRTNTNTPSWAQPVADVAETAGLLVEILHAAGVPDAGDKVSAIGQAIFDTADNSLPRIVHLAIGQLHTAITTSNPVTSTTEEPTS